MARSSATSAGGVAAAADASICFASTYCFEASSARPLSASTATPGFPRERRIAVRQPHIGTRRAILISNVAPREVRRRLWSGGDRRSDRAHRRRLHPEPPYRALHPAAGRAISAHQVPCRRADRVSPCSPAEALAPAHAVHARAAAPSPPSKAKASSCGCGAVRMRRHFSASGSSSPESTSARLAIRPSTLPWSPSRVWRSTFRPRESAPIWAPARAPPMPPAARRSPKPRWSSTAWT